MSWVRFCPSSPNSALHCLSTVTMATWKWRQLERRDRLLKLSLIDCSQQSHSLKPRTDSPVPSRHFLSEAQICTDSGRARLTVAPEITSLIKQETLQPHCWVWERHSADERHTKRVSRRAPCPVATKREKERRRNRMLGRGAFSAAQSCCRLIYQTNAVQRSALAITGAPGIGPLVPRRACSDDPHRTRQIVKLMYKLPKRYDVSQVHVQTPSSEDWDAVCDSMHSQWAQTKCQGRTNCWHQTVHGVAGTE